MFKGGQAMQQQTPQPPVQRTIIMFPTRVGTILPTIHFVGKVTFLKINVLDIMHASCTVRPIKVYY